MSLTSFTLRTGARLLAEAQGSGASLNRLLRRLAIGVALLGILGTLWLLREQTVTVVEMLAEYVRSAEQPDSEVSFEVASEAICCPPT